MGKDLRKTGIKNKSAKYFHPNPDTFALYPTPAFSYDPPQLANALMLSKYFFYPLATSFIDYKYYSFGKSPLQFEQVQHKSNQEVPVQTMNRNRFYLQNSFFFFVL